MSRINHEKNKTLARKKIDTTRKFKLYKSNVNLTTTYFGDKKNPDNFELIVFDYKYGESDILLRYPNTTEFIELSGMFSSIHGELARGSARDVITELGREWILSSKETAYMIDMMKSGDDIMLNFYETVKSTELICLHKTESTNHIEGLEYICLPDFYYCNYSFRLPDNGLTSSYLFYVNNKYHRNGKAFYGNFETGFTEVEIKNKTVYRDGGTTYMDVIVNGELNKFYSPTRFNKELSATWNEYPIVEATNEEVDKFFEVMNLPREKEVDSIIEVRQSEFTKYERFYYENNKS